MQIDAGDEGSGADLSSHEFTLSDGSARGGDIENMPGRTAKRVLECPKRGEILSRGNGVLHGV